MIFVTACAYSARASGQFDRAFEYVGPKGVNQTAVDAELDSTSSRLDSQRLLSVENWSLLNSHWQLFFDRQLCDQNFTFANPHGL
jgi:hypothetical protein